MIYKGIWCEEHLHQGHEPTGPKMRIRCKGWCCEKQRRQIEEHIAANAT